MHIADRSNNRVQVLDAAGNFIQGFGWEGDEEQAQGNGLPDRRPAGSGPAHPDGQGLEAAGGRCRCQRACGRGTGEAAGQGEGKKDRKLDRTGRVKVQPTVTYTPTNGDPNTKSMRIKLVIRR